MSSVIRSRTRHQARVLAACSGAILAAGISAGCATEADDELVEWTSTEQAVTAVGDALPGVTAADFAEALEAFAAVEELDEGLGPVFNEAGCGVCHTQGAIGGAGVQIERRFGRFVNGRFDDLSN